MEPMCIRQRVGEDSISVTWHTKAREARSTELGRIGVVGNVAGFVFVRRWEGNRALYKACERRQGNTVQKCE